MGTGILSVDQVCTAVEHTLQAGLPQVLELPAVKTYLGESARTYLDIKEWKQLPVVQAIATATLPAVAITTPGLVDRPIYSRARNKWEANVRVGIGIYDRNTGTDHSAMQARIRNWVAFMRIALLRNVTLGGVAEGLTWVGEEYDLLPAKNQARTIAAGALSVDIKVDVPDTLGLGLPPVTSTTTQLSVT